MATFLLPPPLTAGSHVALINTGRSFELPIEQTIRLLEEKGWHVHPGHSLVSEPCGQFACDDATRWKDLQDAINNPLIQAIFFVRGGYGMLRILHKLNLDALSLHPKWLVGYSDLTYLHAAVQKNPGMASLHSPMASAWKQTPEEHMEQLFSLLSHKKTVYLWNGLHLSTTFEKITGTITGGNLTLLHSLAAMGELPSTAGKILFLEDIFENLMSIERMLFALKRAGVFDDIKALLLGDFMVPVKDNETSNHLYPGFAVQDEASAASATAHLFDTFFRGADFPVIRFVPVGHMPGRNHPLPLGVPVTLSSREDSISLTVFE